MVITVDRMEELRSEKNSVVHQVDASVMKRVEQENDNVVSGNDWPVLGTKSKDNVEQQCLLSGEAAVKRLPGRVINVNSASIHDEGAAVRETHMKITNDAKPGLSTEKTKKDKKHSTMKSMKATTGQQHNYENMINYPCR